MQPVSTRSDWERVVALRNSFRPHGPSTVDRTMAYAEAHPSRVPIDRRIAVADGEDLAYLVVCQAYWTPEPGRFDGDVFTGPHVSDKAAISSLYETAERMASELGATVVETWAPSYRPEYALALESRGYRPGQRNPESMIDLTAFDPEPWRQKYAPVFEGGLEMLTFDEFEQRFGEEADRMFWRLEMDLFADVPLPSPWVEIPFEDWLRDRQAAPLATEWMFVALDGDRPVGTTQLIKNWVDSTLMHNALTAVRREYRRRGIAAALKSRSLELAKAAGVLRVYTDNEENNPMFGLNVALGYREVHHWVQYERPLA